MIKKYQWFVGVCVLFFVLFAAAEPVPLRVTCTTTLLSAAVKCVGGRHVLVNTVIPFGMCPGHFELSPKEVQGLRSADLNLAHGYERFLDNLVEKDNISIMNIPVGGNWMIPDNQKQAVRYIAGLLADKRPAMSAAFQDNLTYYVALIDAATDAVKPLRERFSQVPVLCSLMNEEFVRWLGFEVIAVFPRDEDISLKTMSRLIHKAKVEGARLVIDNRQSSGKVGKTFAAELNLPLAVLNNFPPEEAGAAGYPQTLKENCTAVWDALLEFSSRSSDAAADQERVNLD